MPSTPLPAALAIAFAVLASGCADRGGDGPSASNGPGGQSASSGQGELAYNGASNGSHSDTFECDGTAAVDIAGNLGSGTLQIRVTDAAGRVHSHTVSGPGQASEHEDLRDGWAAGTWTVSAMRSSNSYGAFSGQYAISVEC
jgi:hypothetical protein